MIGFNLVPILPELFMAVSGMVLLIAGVMRKGNSLAFISWAAVACCFIAAFIMLGFSWHEDVVLNGMFKFDNFAGVMKLSILIGLIASISLSVKYLEDEGIGRFEYPVLMIFAGIGMMLMVSSSNLLSLYMALELQSLSLYVLAAFRRNSAKSAEAGVKYFSLGALSSGMILFGISLIYGFTGTLDYGVLYATFGTMQHIPVGITFGLVFLLGGLAFKISAVPFHMWTPDVYQGAPTSVTAFFAIVPKIAAMAMIMRLLFEPFAAASGQWDQIIIFLSAASMIVGSFAALVQENIKRLLAYSSIGNMGYALIGLATASKVGAGAVVLYLLIYLVMTAGVFAVVLSMRRGGKELETIGDLAGLSRTNPALAYVMAIMMFSMSGIPPMAGFFGKLIIFQAAIESEMYVLAVLGVLTSVVGAYYYLRVVKVMFFDAPQDAFDAGIPFARRVVLFLSAFFVIGFVFKPSLIITIAKNAAASLFVG
ncbi:MAG: NADH-quinone oxidoreductase subunit NuoN [Alphaproteobacteria bacterium]